MNDQILPEQPPNTSVPSKGPAKLRVAEQLANRYSRDQATDSPTQLCPFASRYAIEVRIVDPTGKPVSNVALCLRKNESEVLLHKTNHRGTARFEGLMEGTYQLGLSESDDRLWRLDRTESLTPSEKKSSGDAIWQGVPNANAQASVTHEIAQGECILMLADRFGQLPETLWTANRENFSADRSMVVLYPREQLKIPPREIVYFSVAAGDCCHISVSNAMTEFVVRFLDSFEQPYKGCAYLIKCFAGEDLFPITNSGETDGEGFVRESILPATTRIELDLDTSEGQLQYEFALGNLDPISETSGAISRLNNLGFYCDENDSSSVLGAAATFQWFEELPITGAIDAATRTRLEEQYSF